MGVDEALLATAGGGGPPTLRLYAWSGPWLSVGYGQPEASVPAAACARAGVGVVRRPTGGRAVLHGADLTYAIAAPEDALPPGLEGSYGLVAETLVRALRSLGVAVEAAPRKAAPGPDAAFDCFESPAADEICAGGRKLVGSAQRRVRGALLQHGSIRLAPDPEAARRAAGFARGVATSLAELDCPASESEVRAALEAAFADSLGPLEPAGLTAAEGSRAASRT